MLEWVRAGRFGQGWSVVFWRMGKRERQLRRDAERGDSAAAYALGVSYRERHDRAPHWPEFGWPKRSVLREKALHYLKLAADAGNMAAVDHINHLAWTETRWIAPELIGYVRTAADRGNLDAAYRLGHNIDREAAAPPAATPQEAERYLRQAADGGHRGAARMLGMFLATTYVGRKEAEHYLRLATDREDPDPDLERAAEVYQRRHDIEAWEFSNRPNKRAEAELAQLLWRTGRAAEAVKYYERALEQPVRGDDYAKWAAELERVFTSMGRGWDAKRLRDQAREVREAWDRLE